MFMHAKLLQSCPTLCKPMDCTPSCSSVHGILQARSLEWESMPSSRGSSQPRDPNGYDVEKEWQSTPVFLLGESRGRRSLAGYGPWVRKESDMTERLTHTHNGYEAVFYCASDLHFPNVNVIVRLGHL